MKWLIFISLQLLTVVCLAQINIDDIAYPGYGSILYRNIDTVLPKGIDLTKTGEQTWNFKKLKRTSTETLYVIDPVGTLGYSYSNSSNYATRKESDDGNTNFAYSNINEDSACFLLHISTNPILNYTFVSPPNYYIFKTEDTLSKNSVFSEINLFKFDSYSMIIKTKKNVTLNLNSWGTIILPKYKHKVFLSHKKIIQQDSVFIKDDFGIYLDTVINYSHDHYTWYEYTKNYGLVNILSATIMENKAIIEYLDKAVLTSAFRKEK